jgi:DNA-binding GntR family transcriptional regulator
MTKAAIEPIERVSIVDSIADRLRDRILSNDLPEGYQLRQEAVAEEYSVSRMPVREALRQLEAQGLVVFHPHRGAVVSRLKPAEIEELYDLRALIETDLVRRATPLATPADHRASEAALQASEAIYDQRDVGRWVELNWRFHEALYRPANRERSLAIARTLNFNTDRYIRLQLSLTGRSIERTKQEHRDLFEAYRTGDGEEAARHLHDHLVHARDALMSRLRAS